MAPAAQVQAKAPAPPAPPPPAPPARTRNAPERTSVLKEYFTCPFDMRAAAGLAGVSISEFCRQIGVNGSANYHNWERATPGRVPLSVAKAACEVFGAAYGETAPMFEASVDGKIERRRVAMFISDVTARLARQYDRKRPGVSLALTTGEVLRIPANIPPEPEPRDDAIAGTIAGPIAGPIAEAIPGPAAVSSEIASASVLPAMPALPTHYEINTPAGVVRVELPAASMVTPGERELLTALVLRLNVQLTEVHRQNHELLILNRSLESQASGLRGRIKELIDERGQLIEKARDVAAKGVTALQAATSPKIATTSDFAAVKAAVRVAPELERLVAAMQTEANAAGAHTGDANAGFTPGAASAASLH